MSQAVIEHLSRRAVDNSLRSTTSGKNRAVSPFARSLLASGYFVLFRFGAALLVAVYVCGFALGQDAETSARQTQRAALQRQLREQAQLLEAQSNVLRLAAKLISPSVVYIEADVPPAPGLSLSRGRSEESGSGVIIEHRGRYYVLTNRHVIRNAEPRSIKINLADGRRLHPSKVFDDAATDVAVLVVEAADLVPAPLGNSDRLQIGDFVLAFGSPFGLSQSVTFGIISAKGRRALKLGPDDAEDLELKDFLQTDAAIHPGNSGGPLVDIHGEVVGINTAIASRTGRNEGIGFAIPINMFMTFARQLIETGRVARAFLGVNLNANFTTLQAAEAGLPRAVGAQVTAVTPGSPAEAAKLQAGDVIVEFNNVPVEDDSHLVNLVGLTEVGRKVTLVIFRDRRPMSLTVELSRREKNGQ